ncbi:MAG: hypothetical protein Q3976_10105 [Corynebacterium sp.]|nr:hypothetical protein [Corynebacterium sp.]
MTQNFVHVPGCPLPVRPTSILDKLRKYGWAFEAILAPYGKGMSIQRSGLKARVDEAFLEVRAGMLPCPENLSDLQLLLTLDDAYRVCRVKIFANGARTVLITDTKAEAQELYGPGFAA